MITDFLVVAEVVRNIVKSYPDSTQEQLQTKIREGLILQGIPSCYHGEWKSFIQLVIEKTKESTSSLEEESTVSPN